MLRIYLFFFFKLNHIKLIYAFLCSYFHLNSLFLARAHFDIISTFNTILKIQLITVLILLITNIYFFFS